jgi:hypothetical protein
MTKLLDDLDKVLTLVRAELISAWAKHPTPFHNAHEGYAVLKEEADALWDEVKENTAYTKHGMNEAVQTAAMAIRFVVELHDHPKAIAGQSLDLPAEARDALQSMFPPQRQVPRMPVNVAG